jgi:hypothetical protein
MFNNYTMQRNEARRCKAPDCHRMRSRYSSCCHVHHERLHQYGHCWGKALLPRTYAVDEAEIAAFVEAHVGHAAITASVSWLQSWIDRACRGEPGTPAARAFQRLNDHGVTALQVFVRAIAVWIHCYRNKRAVPDDMRALDYAISRAVLALAPRERIVGATRTQRRYRSHPASARREIGPAIRDKLAPVFASIVVGLEEQHNARLKRAEDLRRPFAIVLPD